MNGLNLHYQPDDGCSIWFELLIIGAAGYFCGWYVIHALKTKRVQVRGKGTFKRSQDPIWYWGCVGTMAFFALLIGAFALLAVTVGVAKWFGR